MDTEDWVRKAGRKEQTDVGKGPQLNGMMKSGPPGQQGLVLFPSFKTTAFSFDCLQPKTFLEITLPAPPES